VSPHSSPSRLLHPPWQLRSRPPPSLLPPPRRQRPPPRLLPLGEVAVGLLGRAAGSG
jgi:hypothetical protein